MNRILLVEDEVRIREYVAPYLTQAGYEVDECGDGDEGLAMAQSGRYDLAILDVMLPGTNGLDICRTLRRTSKMPVIMLTARSEENDIITGFDAGADDYVTKPFSPRELMARVKALLVRSSALGEDNRVTLGALSIDTDAREVFVDGTEITLTPREYDLLLIMAQNPKKVFTREQLLSKVWGYDFYGDTRTVDTHVKQLREKLGVRRNMLSTIWGKGYKLEDAAALS